MTSVSDRLYAAAPVTEMSNLGTDANGCGSPVLNHMGLMARVILRRSINVGALCDADSAKSRFEKNRGEQGV
jgi:hypothetical protein